VVLRSQLRTVGNGVFGIAAGDRILPLQARMQAHALVYFDDPYFVCRVRAGGPEEQWCSVLTLENTFGFGTYYWRAKASSPGSHRHHWLGGFERHHGFPTDGMIGFWILDGTCKVMTCSDGICEDTVFSQEDWTSERIFKIIWSPLKVEYFLEETLLATHTKNVPKEPMNFFFEAGRIGGTTPVDHAVYFRKDSFTKVD